MERYYVNKDVFEVFFESANGKDYFVGLGTTTGVSKETNTEHIKGGIGAPIVATLKSDDGFTVEVETDVYYDDVSELIAGVDFEEVDDIELVDVKFDDDGKLVTEKKEVAGRVLELEAGAFPKAGKLQLRTILFDPKTEKPALELYYIFYNAAPDGTFEEVFEMENPNGQTLTFTPMAQMQEDGSRSYGKKIFVPIEDEEGVSGGLGDLNLD